MSTVVTLGPVGFKPTGAYDNTREYKKLDVVIYQGSCYIAKSDSIGQLPTNTTYWELLVQKGDTGKGITSIAKTGTSGLVDTYTITYTDETTSTFTVTNGEKGDPGEVTEEQLDEAMARANMVYNALPKVSDEGDSLTLDGTANCPMKMELKGNTEQTTYTGKNLLEPYNDAGTKHGITCTYDNTNQIYTFNGTCTADNTSFIISNQTIEFINGITTVSAHLISGSVSNYCTFRTFDVDFGRNTPIDLTLLSNNEPIIYATCNGSNYSAAYISLRFQAGSVANNLKVKFMIADSTDTTYEPYVGGTPSPNPDYPQDVRVATGNNSVKVEGKNILNITNAYSNSTDLEKSYINGVASLTWNAGFAFYMEQNESHNQPLDMFDSSKTYTISFKHKGDSLYLRFDETYNNILATGTDSDYTDYSYTFTGLNQLVIKFVRKESSGTAYLKDFQIEINNQATTYEPYQSQTNPVNLGTIELCKIGTYQDYIYKDNGKWYKHSEIGKVVLDGSEANWNMYGSSGARKWYLAKTYFTNKNIEAPFTNTIDKCNRFQVSQYISGNWVNNKFGWHTGANSLIFYTDFGESISDWTIWLSNNNVIVYYVLETPTNTEITDTTLISQLNAIENAVSYDTQTNIVQENYSEPFIINAECVRSLKDIFELIQ